MRIVPNEVNLKFAVVIDEIFQFIILFEFWFGDQMVEISQSNIHNFIICSQPGQFLLCVLHRSFQVKVANQGSRLSILGFDFIDDHIAPIHQGNLQVRTEMNKRKPPLRE